MLNVDKQNVLIARAKCEIPFDDGSIRARASVIFLPTEDRFYVHHEDMEPSGVYRMYEIQALPMEAFQNLEIVLVVGKCIRMNYLARKMRMPYENTECHPEGWDGPCMCDECRSYGE